MGDRVNLEQILKIILAPLKESAHKKYDMHCPFPHQFVDQGQKLKILISESIYCTVDWRLSECCNWI
jgi:hypothetical protein